MQERSTHRKQCTRYDVESQPHCLTFSTFRRQPFLTNPQEACQWCLQAMQLGRDKGMFDLWAYVIMPEHLHVVLLPSAGVAISQILTTIKQSSSKRALLWAKARAPEFLASMVDQPRRGKLRHRFWQRGGGYDRNLRTIRDLHEKIRYVHENPVRRRLVARVDDWVWSSCRSWETGQDEPIGLDRESLPPLVK